MKNRNRRQGWVLGVSLCGLLAVGLLVGCEIDSAESAVRQVNLNVAGIYRNPNSGGLVVTGSSGAPISQFDLRQTGDRLEAIDNNTRVYRGSIGSVTEGTTPVASITLEGTTTAGQRATLSGTIEVSGTDATMRGTWVEDALYGTVYGKATVDPTPTNPPIGSLTITPAGPLSLTVGATQSFTASGGAGTSYSWSLSSSSLGALNGTTGATVEYTAAASGNQTVSVSDGEATATVAITQSGGTNLVARLAARPGS
ncbi:MAG: hypothetical protein K9N49_10695 [Candidatus Marinimicrobia bacterium]|nr:hypothetical protein [Candidatus Neomarinimicrobiota bacterium]